MLAEIGLGGTEPEKLVRNGREFQELEREGLIVFWPVRGSRPHRIYGGGIAPGRWYLTAAGAAAVGLDSQSLRLG